MNNKNEIISKTCYGTLFRNIISYPPKNEMCCVYVMEAHKPVLRWLVLQKHTNEYRNAKWNLYFKSWNWVREPVKSMSFFVVLLATCNTIVCLVCNLKTFQNSPLSLVLLNYVLPLSYYIHNTLVLCIIKLTASLKVQNWIDSVFLCKN